MARICDRCKSPDETGVVAWYSMSMWAEDFSADLCKSCRKALKKWLKGPPGNFQEGQ